MIGGDFGENPRLDRVWDIASRYEENIMRTRQFAKDARKVSTSIGTLRHNNYMKMQNRKYSLKTYIGLSNG